MKHGRGNGECREWGAEWAVPFGIGENGVPIRQCPLGIGMGECQEWGAEWAVPFGHWGRALRDGECREWGVEWAGRQGVGSGIEGVCLDESECLGDVYCGGPPLW